MQEKSRHFGGKSNIFYNYVISLSFFYTKNQPENPAEKFRLFDHNNFHKQPPSFTDDDAENNDSDRKDGNNKRFRANHSNDHACSESRKIVAELIASSALSHVNTTTAFLILYYAAVEEVLQLPIPDILDLVIHRFVAFVA